MLRHRKAVLLVLALTMGASGLIAGPIGFAVQNLASNPASRR